MSQNKLQIYTILSNNYLLYCLRDTQVIRVIKSFCNTNKIPFSLLLPISGLGVLRNEDLRSKLQYTQVGNDVVELVELVNFDELDSENNYLISKNLKWISFF